MVSRIDERTCPQCGHGVLSWDFVCPGCQHVPWNTPAGRRELTRRRRLLSLSEIGPFHVLVFLSLVLVVAGNFAWIKLIRAPQHESRIVAIQEKLSRPDPAVSPAERQKLLDDLAGFLKRDDYRIGFRAALVLGQAGDRRGIRWLISMLDYRRNPRVAASARTLLTAMTGEDVGADRKQWEAWLEQHQGE